MHANPASATSMNVCHVTMLKDKHKENKAKRNMNMEAERTPNWGKQPMQHDTEINGGKGRVVSTGSQKGGGSQQMAFIRRLPTCTVKGKPEPLGKGSANMQEVYASLIH